MTAALPPPTFAGDTVATCPWCRQETDAATVTLEDLIAARESGQITDPEREEDGTAHHNALVANCSQCERPFMVGLHKPDGLGRCMTLTPVRTATDAKFETPPYPDPPWPVGSETNANGKRSGWISYFHGKAREACPFPPERRDLQDAYRLGWDAAREGDTCATCGEPLTRTVHGTAGCMACNPPPERP